MSVRETPVLIVGGGGCGLACSLLLSDLEVPSLLIERHPGTSRLAKAHILNPRTMEIFAQLGIADEVYATGAPFENYEATRWYTSLGGEDPWDRRCLHRIDSWSGGQLRPYYQQLSAMRTGNLPQKLLEPILQAHAEARNPGGVLFGHELVALSQHEGHVLAQVRERATNQTYEVQAQYLVGADGGKTVGDAVDGQMLGPDPFVDQISIHIRADLSQYLEDDDSQIRLFVRPTLDGDWVQFGMVAMGPHRFDRHCEEWHVAITLPLTGEHTSERYDEAAAIRDVRALLKLPDLDLKVLDITHWLVEGVHAEHYQFGRVLLAGDAAHRHSPMGGLGLNTAIQDAHNLAWKLAAVVRGQANPALIDSYEAERLPVGARNVEFATFSFFNHLGARAAFGMLPGAPPQHNRAVLESLFAQTTEGAIRRLRMAEIFQTLRFEFQAADIELGFTYAGSPAIVDDGSPAPPRDPSGHSYHPVARPGHRLPHCWLERAGERLSTHELLQGDTFVLLAGATGETWMEAASAIDRDDSANKLRAHRIGADADLSDQSGEWARLRGHGDNGAMLVRPDGHVLFRAQEASVDPKGDLHQALRTALGHTATRLEAAR